MRAKRVDLIPRIAAIGTLVEPRVEQSGPVAAEFVYVDIGSVDRESKRIIDPKILSKNKAPSRARQRLKAGDVLVSMTRPNLNAVAIVPREYDQAIGSTGFHVLRATKAISSYLYYAVQSPQFIDAMCAKVQGALYPAVRPKDIAGYEIPLPDEAAQRRIVAEIEKQFTRLDAGVAALKRVQANLKRYRAAVLKAACEGRLVPTEAELTAKYAKSTKKNSGSVSAASAYSAVKNPGCETGEQLLQRILAERRKNWTGHGKYKEPAAPNMTDLPPLPDGWEWATVEQLLRDESGLAYGILKPGVEDPCGVPMVRVMDIGDGRMSGTEIMKVSPELSDAFRRTLLEKRDILLAVMATVGRCTVVPDFLIGANVNRALAVIKPTPHASSDFLAMAIRSPRVQHLFQTNKIGSAQARINLSNLRLYALPLPPLTEQTRIVAEVERRLSVIDELEAVVTANLARTSRLRQSVLCAAFSARSVTESAK